MPKTQCNKCWKEYEIKNQFEGKKAKCSKCGNMFQIIFIKNNQQKPIIENKKIEKIQKKKKNIFFRIIKNIFIFLFSSIFIFLAGVFISSLFLYDEDTFNIPQNAFETKFSDLDENSLDNWFNDFIDFTEMLDNREDIKYFELLSECIFDDDYTDIQCNESKNYYINKYKRDAIYSINKELDPLKYDSTNPQTLEYTNLVRQISNNETIPQNYISEFPILKEYVDIKNDFEGFVNKKYFKTFKNFTHVNSFKFKQINSKKFISYNDEYKNSYGWAAVIRLAWFSDYFKSVRYVAYNYAENWEHEKSIWILLEHQKFIDTFINQSESNPIMALILIQNSKVNINAIKYILENYPVTSEIKNNIKIILEEKIDGDFIINTLKVNHNLERWVFQEIYKNSFIKSTFDSTIWVSIESIKALLFFDVEETELLSDKVMYDILNSPDYTSGFTCWFNISNYIWRDLVCKNILMNNSLYFEKFNQMLELRENILEFVK